jgi:hypothetical protein
LFGGGAYVCLLMRVKVDASGNNTGIPENVESKSVF